LPQSSCKISLPLARAFVFWVWLWLVYVVVSRINNFAKMLLAMKQTFALSPNLANDIEALRRDLGFADAETTIQYLLQSAVAREKKQIVVRLNKNQETTMRQCAENLGVDLEEMMNILREFHVSFNGALAEQLEAVKKFTKGMQPA